jgi:hypothetical protein
MSHHPQYTCPGIHLVARAASSGEASAVGEARIVVARVAVRVRMVGKYILVG